MLKHKRTFISMKWLVALQVIFLPSALRGEEVKLQVTLHAESGEPVLTWTHSEPAVSSFNLYRSGTPGVETQKKHLFLQGMGRGERHFIDMRTFPNNRYFYRVAALDSNGKIIALSNEAGLESHRKGFGIEGQLPFILGWSGGEVLADQLHVNLLFGGPTLRPMVHGKRIWRMTKYDDMHEKSGCPLEERYRNVVLDPWHVGWDLYDEKWSPQEERKKVEEIRNYDAFGPIAGNVMPQQGPTKMAGVTEIFSVEHYSTQANWPTIAVPAVERAMRDHEKQWPLLPIRQLWMCFDTYSVTSAGRPTAFLRVSVYSALGYGAKGLYFFNDPGSHGFLDGPGIRLMPRQQEMVGIMGAEMQAWGRHLLYSQFDGEGITGTVRNSLAMSDNKWWVTEVHKAYPKTAGKRWPAVQAVLQKHPRGRFLFVWANMDADYWAKEVKVRVQRELPEKVKAYRLSPGLPEIGLEKTENGFSVLCGNIYGAECFLITSDTEFANMIQKDINRITPELKKRYQALAKKDLQDAKTFLALCPISPKRQTFEDQVRQTERKSETDGREKSIDAERLFRSILNSGLRNAPPYAVKGSELRRGTVVPKGMESSAENLALMAKCAKAGATTHEWVFPGIKDQRNSPHLAIDGILSPPLPEKQKWGGENSAWVFRSTPADPYPVLTIELPEARRIGELRIKQFWENKDIPPGIKWLVVEFVEDQRIEVFNLPATGDLVRLEFPARKTRTIRLLPLKYNEDATVSGLCEVEIYPTKLPIKDFSRIPLTRRHADVDLTTFGW